MQINEKLPDIAEQVLNLLPEDIRGDAREYFAEASAKEPNLRNSSLKFNTRNSLYDQVVTRSGIGQYNPDKIPMSIYSKMSLDPEISLATSEIVLPIVAQSFRIESTNEDISLVIHHLMNPIYRKLISDLLTAIKYGFSVGEIVYEKRMAKITRLNESGEEEIVYEGDIVAPKKIKFVEPKTISVIRDKKTEEVKWIVQKNVNPFKKAPRVRPNKVIWFAPDSEFGNIFGTSRYKAAYQPWYWFQILVQFMLKYLERRGGPTTVGKAPKGSTIASDGKKIDNLDLALAMAKAVSSNTSVAMESSIYPESSTDKWGLKILEDSGRGDMFLDALNFLNVQKMRAMKIPDKVGVAEGSSTNATAENNTDIHLLNEESLIQKIESAINTQIIEPLIEYNFVPEERRSCKIKIERLNHGKRTLLKDTLLRMMMFSSGAENKPKSLPSIQKMCELLEVPTDQYYDIFSDSDTVDKSAETSTADKEDAKKDNDKKTAVLRKKKTGRERKSKTRYTESGEMS